MPDEYVNLCVAVAADGTVVEATFPQERVADIRVQPFGSGSYDVAFITTTEVSPSHSVAKVATDGDGQALVEAMYCNFSTASLSDESRSFDHQVTVRVQTSRGADRADCGFRLDLQLA
ncbi:hypothetical protein [Nocardia thraciensis]